MLHLSPLCAILAPALIEVGGGGFCVVFLVDFSAFIGFFVVFHHFIDFLFRFRSFFVVVSAALSFAAGNWIIARTQLVRPIVETASLA